MGLETQPDVPKHEKDQDHNELKITMEQQIIERACMFAENQEKCAHEWIKDNAEEYAVVFSNICTQQPELIENFETDPEEVLEAIEQELEKKKQTI